MTTINTKRSVLDDLLVDDLDVVFCGTAAGNTSARIGRYYAGPGNQFWPVLHAIGLTPRQLAPSEFRELITYGIGLTDVCKRASGNDHDLRYADFDVAGFWERLEQNRPRIVAFNGKQAAKSALRLPTVAYGPHHTTPLGLPAFVLPSTSGAARGHWNIAYWRELARQATRP
jgi:TDG/mug DNA glycosylase family protein